MDEATARERLRYLELKAKASQQPEYDKGVLGAFGQGLVRSIPKGLDFGGSIVAEGYNLVAPKEWGGGYPVGSYLSQDGPVNKLTSFVIGEEPNYKPWSNEAIAQFVGEIVGPVAAIKGAKNFVGFLRGLGGSMDDFIRNPEQLKAMYTAWEKGLIDTKVSGKEIREKFLKPVLEDIGYDAKYATKEAQEKLLQAKKLASSKGTNMADVYAFRRSLSNVKDNAIVEPLRKGTKELIAEKAGTEGLDAYRRMSLYKDTNKALRNMGNEGIRATRTKINNLDELGMTAEELAAKYAAGRGGLLEGALRTGGKGMNTLTSTLAGYMTNNPAVTAGMYGVGRGLEKAADKMATSRIKALQEVLLNQRKVPNIGERLGAGVREIPTVARKTSDWAIRKQKALVKALGGE